MEELLDDFAQRGVDPAELEDLGWGIHQGEPDLPLCGPQLAHAVVRPKLLHLVEGGGGEVFDDEEVEVVRAGTPGGGEGLPLEEEDCCPVGFVGESEDEGGGGVRDPRLSLALLLMRKPSSMVVFS